MQQDSSTHKGLAAWLIVAAVLIIDQIIKISVRTHFALGESYEVTPWFYLHFIENNGMAYGMTFINKVALSIFRIVAVSAIGYYIYMVVRRGARWRYVVFLSMIAAGAGGNIIDSLFYGQIFPEASPWEVQGFVPLGEGYAPVLMGKVVDMFYFPLIHTTWPDWMPVVGGDEFIFFSPIFNFADASISVGVICLLLFCRKDFESKDPADNADDADSEDNGPKADTIGQTEQNTKQS